MYLPADAQDRLFERVTDLSAAGSRIAAETVGLQFGRTPRTDAGEVRTNRRHQLGVDDTLDIGELTYEDPDRADVRQCARRAWLASGGRHVAGRDAPSWPGR